MDTGGRDFRNLGSTLLLVSLLLGSSLGLRAAAAPAARLPVTGLPFPVDSSSAPTNAGPIPAPLTRDAFLPDDLRAADPATGAPGTPAAPEPGFLDTSRYLMGSVAVAIILPESNGGLDPNQEDWTPAEIGTVMAEIQAGLSWWASANPNAFLRFVYDPASPRVVPTPYEPINRPSSDEGLWILQVMTALGYTTGDYFTRVRTFDNDLRAARGTDWAFTIFVVDSSVDDDGSFTDGFSAYAYFGGPFFVLTYDNGGWGIANMDFVAAHEMGHTFWATDEYDQGPTMNLDPGFDDQSLGYLDIQEIWLSGCLMHTNVFCLSDAAPPALSGSRGTTGQIGWRDSGGNPGVFDILDVPPETTLTPYAPDPSADETPTYTGSATVVAFPSPTGTAVTINTIADVEYRVDGGSWTSATPDDGAFDGAMEAFRFTPSLVEGTHTLEVRATLVVPTPTPTAIVDPSPAADILTIEIPGANSAVDPLPPYTTSSVFPVTATSPQGANVELFYAKDGGAWTSYGSDGTPPFSFAFETSLTGGDGRYEFHTIATDAGGVIESAPATADASTLVDTVAPTSAVDVMPLITGIPAFVVTATASDPNGITAVELFYRKDGRTWRSHGIDGSFPWAWNFDASAAGGDGLYEFYALATDLPGNTEAAPATREALTFVDTLPPTSRADPLPAFHVSSAFLVTATASDAGSGVAQVDLYYRKDGGPWTSYGVDTSFPWSWTFDASAPGDGGYEFHTLAMDGLGQTDAKALTSEASTTVDTVPPTSSHVLAGTAGAAGWYWDDATVILSAVDGTSGVASSHYRLDGGAVQTYAGPFLVDSGGPHTLAYFSVDAAGNAETARSVQFGVDREAPTLALTAPAPGALLFASVVTVEWAASDAGSGIASCSLAVDGGPPLSVGLLASHSLVDLPDGTHRVTVSCVDTAGRTAEEGVEFTFVTTNVLGTPLGGSWLQLILLVAILLVGVGVFLWFWRRRAGGRG